MEGNRGKEFNTFPGTPPTTDRKIDQPQTCLGSMKNPIRHHHGGGGGGGGGRREEEEEKYV